MKNGKWSWTVVGEVVVGVILAAVIVGAVAKAAR